MDSLPKAVVALSQVTEVVLRRNGGIRVKRWLVVLCLFCTLTGCGESAERPGPEQPLKEVMVQGPLTPPVQTVVQTPRPVLASAEHVLDTDLRWRECVVSGFDWREGQACLGYSLSSL